MLEPDHTIPEPRVIAPDFSMKTYPLNYNLEQACRIIGVSRPTLGRMIERGELEASKDGKTWKVSTISIFKHLGFECRVVNNHDNY